MFSKNLKYYRLRKHLSKKDLAMKVNITPMAITNYETGERMPNMEIMKSLASVLEVRVSDFLTVRNEGLSFLHGEFRKNTKLSNSQQEYIRESVEEYFTRFMTVIEILGGDVLPSGPECSVLSLSTNPETDAHSLRKHLGFASDGPIEDLFGKLENKGILIFECPLDGNSFSGMNGFVNDRPYIVLNPNMNPERVRSTTVHELAHLMFRWPEERDDKDNEQLATAISGAFLFPQEDLVRELGIHRSAITGDMVEIAKEYGVSMLLLVKRAEQCGVIRPAVAKNFFKRASMAGWRTSEPARIEPESSRLFKQLVYRAVTEQEISVQRGAELLKVPYKTVLAMCESAEV